MTGGFDLALEQAGFQISWQIEIDRACNQVLECRWPHVKRYWDVTQVKGADLEPVDLICGGFPCQGLSVAGKRLGLADERSGLFFQFVRLIGEIKPHWVLIENVPGLLSSNQGVDIQIVVDSLTQIGYIVDIDIADAQYFGLAQRRRRIFLVCVRLDGLLPMKTCLSKQIWADLIVQQLLDIWGVIPQASSVVPLRSGFGKPPESCAGSLQKRTRLLETALANSVFKTSATYWADVTALFMSEDLSSDSSLTEKPEQLEPLLPAMGTYEFLLKKAGFGDGCMSIPTLLNKLSEDLLNLENKSIISTETERITEERIYTFAVMAAHTILSIGHFSRCFENWSPSYWSVISSASTLLQELMNYARQSSNELFGSSELRADWWNYLGATREIADFLECHSRRQSAAKVLFEPESVCRDTPPSREAGAKVARTLESGANRTGGTRPPGSTVDNAADLQVVALPLNAHAHRDGDRDTNYLVGLSGLGSGGAADNDAQAGRLAVAYPLRAGRQITDSNGNQGNVITIRTAQTGSNGWGISQDTAYTLDGATGQDRLSSGVRRLTPLECTRLQGFPDDYFDGIGLSDSAKYRCLGNAVAVPVAKWIAGRILQSL